MSECEMLYSNGCCDECELFIDTPTKKSAASFLKAMSNFGRLDELTLSLLGEAFDIDARDLCDHHGMTYRRGAAQGLTRYSNINQRRR